MKKVLQGEHSACLLLDFKQEQCYFQRAACNLCSEHCSRLLELIALTKVRAATTRQMAREQDICWPCSQVDQQQETYCSKLC